ncbi:hypothetical protein FGO68_gene2723 [Halteria grandinella]|uniref:Uncharacterized protein n=1 Tax=Halteria grandinella TaxID=5974 RepID=A0A8J8NTI3_HALGN|nr:hypothetical protein FGO68_gene2723 [Halteria grandinella]
MKKITIVLLTALLKGVLAIQQPPLYFQGRTTGLADVLFNTNYTISGDAYYEIKDEGYYSPDVFEGFVGQPVVQVTIGIQLEYWSTLLKVLQVKAHHHLNLLKVTLGLSYHLSTRYFDEACLRGFAAIEGLSLNHRMKTNVLSCGDDLFDQNEVLARKLNMCVFDKMREQEQDLGPLEFAALRLEGWPFAMCI